MPFYNWKCSECEKVWEIFQTMTEHKEDPPAFCPTCDPNGEGGVATLEQILVPGHLPKFIVKGEGAFYPDKMQ